MTGHMERARGRLTSRVRGPDFLRLDEVAAASGRLGVPRTATPRMDLMRLAGIWSTVVGSHLCAVTRPAWYDLRHLVVEVKDTAWKRELEHLTPEIMSRLEALAGLPMVDGITFRVRAARFRTTQTDPGKRLSRDEAMAANPRQADLSPELRAPLETITDVSLRDRLQAVMGKYLTRAAASAH